MKALEGEKTLMVPVDECSGRRKGSEGAVGEDSGRRESYEGTCGRRF